MSGCGEGSGNHISMYVYLMEGPQMINCSQSVTGHSVE